MWNEMLRAPLIVVKISQRGGVPQCEAKWLQGVVKTDQSNERRNFSRGAQNGHCVRRRAQTYIPDDEFARVMAQAVRQLKLLDIECLRFSRRADDRMKRLTIRQRVHAMNAVGESDDTVSCVRWHMLNI